MRIVCERKIIPTSLDGGTVTTNMFPSAVFCHGEEEANVGEEWTVVASLDMETIGSGEGTLLVRCLEGSVDIKIVAGDDTPIIGFTLGKGEAQPLSVTWTGPFKVLGRTCRGTARVRVQFSTVLGTHF